MKIVYCIPQLYCPGGIERIVTIKANYLAEHFGHDITIVAANQRGQEPFYPLSPKIKLLDLDLAYEDTLALGIVRRMISRRKLHKKHKRLLTKLLTELHPDITISTFTHEAAFLPDIKDGSKKILEFHFCKGHKRFVATAFGYSPLIKFAYFCRCWEEENIIVPKYDQFVVLTEEDRASWISKVPSVLCIHDITPFECEETARLQNHKAIAVGRLDAQKGFDRLIRIWNLVHDHIPDWQLYIYGDGADRKLLQSMIDSYHLTNVIHLQMPVQNIKDRYLDASIFVMTSRFEGQGMNILEAESLGLPIVSYDFPCGPKDAILDGTNGYIVSDDDESTFCERIIRLAEDEEMRKNFGAASKKQSAKFGSEYIMNQWNDLFKRILEK